MRRGISFSMFLSVSKILMKRSDLRNSSCSWGVIGKERSALHIKEVPGRPVKSVLMPTQRDLNCAWIILRRSSADTFPLLLGIYCCGLWFCDIVLDFICWLIIINKVSTNLQIEFFHLRVHLLAAHLICLMHCQAISSLSMALRTDWCYLLHTCFHWRSLRSSWWRISITSRCVTCNKWDKKTSVKPWCVCLSNSSFCTQSWFLLTSMIDNWLWWNWGAWLLISLSTTCRRWRLLNFWLRAHFLIK